MQTAKLNETDLRNYMQIHAIHGEIVYLSTPTPTVETAAMAVGTQVEQIIKSILFIVDGQPVLAIACGLSSIKQRAIAEIYGVSKGKVKLASPEMVLDVSGYEVGAMPPFGHRQPLPTLIDKRVLDLPEAYAGGGAENALLRFNPVNLLGIRGARLCNLLE
jgi:prolyl-tRNA editing enzyme YbaK/EbsC (Cys-tRNA(Pro) deacylase)